MERKPQHCEACHTLIDAGLYCQACRDTGHAFVHFASLLPSPPILVKRAWRPPFQLRERNHS